MEPTKRSVMITNPHIGILGLGYVGLPLAVAFGKVVPTLGFDNQAKRIHDLKQGIDGTLELSSEQLQNTHQLQFSDQPHDLQPCNVYIVTVPTPVDAQKRPDLKPIFQASKTVSHVLTKGNVVIYESTVYPGATEEDCVPILEQGSGLTFNKDFSVGYSPERINPGDKKRRLEQLVKVVSGSTTETAHFIDQLYRRIIPAGTHIASSIRVAEAAKVIENIQRDINIAFMNELAMLFNLLEIDIQDVLAVASSKWNFLKFQPGLVGGHCIGVDPYYLTHKAQEIGYFPEIILAGRRINDMMGSYITKQVMQIMIRKKLSLVDAHILVMGLTFKENCPDIRNTRVIDIVTELNSYDLKTSVYDPWVSPQQGYAEYGLKMLTTLQPGTYHAIILAVAHQAFIEMGVETIRELGIKGAVIYDVKHILPANCVDGRL